MKLVRGAAPVKASDHGGGHASYEVTFNGPGNFGVGLVLSSLKGYATIAEACVRHCATTGRTARDDAPFAAKKLHAAAPLIRSSP